MVAPAEITNESASELRGNLQTRTSVCSREGKLWEITEMVSNTVREFPKKSGNLNGGFIKLLKLAPDLVPIVVKQAWRAETATDRIAAVQLGEAKLRRELHEEDKMRKMQDRGIANGRVGCRLIVTLARKTRLIELRISWKVGVFYLREHWSPSWDFARQRPVRLGTRHVCNGSTEKRSPWQEIGRKTGGQMVDVCVWSRIGALFAPRNVWQQTCRDKGVPLRTSVGQGRMSLPVAADDGCWQCFVNGLVAAAAWIASGEFIWCGGKGDVLLPEDRWMVDLGTHRCLDGCRRACISGVGRWIIHVRIYKAAPRWPGRSRRAPVHEWECRKLCLLMVRKSEIHLRSIFKDARESMRQRNAYGYPRIPFISLCSKHRWGFNGSDSHITRRMNPTCRVCIGNTP